MRGRRKEPAQAKVIKGNFRPDRDSHGPAVDVQAPKCPSWLPKEAKKYWKDIAPKLVSAGLIGIVDGAAFIAHCDSMGKFEQVSRELINLDDLYASTPQGFMVQSALFTIRNKLWDQVIKSSSEFGLSPASRSKVKETSQQNLPFDEWRDM